MKVIKTNKPLSTAEQYKLTMSPNVQKMSDMKGQRIEIKNFCLYEDTNSKGEEQTILAIETPEGEVIATNSATFKDDFDRMWTLFADNGETVNAITVETGKSKNNRDFITCAYAA